MEDYKGEIFAKNEQEKMLFTMMLTSCGYGVSINPIAGGGYKLVIYVNEKRLHLYIRKSEPVR